MLDSIQQFIDLGVRQQWDGAEKEQTERQDSELMYGTKMECLNLSDISVAIKRK